MSQTSSEVWELVEEEAIVFASRLGKTIRWSTPTPLRHDVLVYGGTPDIPLTDWHIKAVNVERETYYPQRQLHAAIQAATSGQWARLTALEERVAELETALSERPVAVPLHDLPGFQLEAPMVALVETIEGGYLARMPELDLWSDGVSESEAIDELKANVATLARDLLEAPNETLGRHPRRWKAVLNRLIVRTA